MTLFHQGSKIVTMRRFAGAAILAALLCTTGAAQTMDMPANCQQQMQRCSLKVWPHNSLKTGETVSVKFSNGAVLTCTSTGPDKPRNCKFTPSPEDPALRQQCADLKEQLRDLMNDQNVPQTMVGQEREFLARAMQMTPAKLDREIQSLERLIEMHQTAPPGTSKVSDQMYATERNDLNFLRDLRNSQTLGPELGGATTQQMQARAKQMVKNQQAWADEQQRLNSQTINSVNDELGRLNCNNVPSVDQSVPK